MIFHVLSFACAVKSFACARSNMVASEQVFGPSKSGHVSEGPKRSSLVEVFMLLICRSAEDTYPHWYSSRKFLELDI